MNAPITTPVAAKAANGGANSLGRSSQDEWRRALAKYEEVKNEYDTFATNVFDPAHRAEVAFEEDRGLVHRLPNGEWARGYFERRKAFQEEHGTGYCVPDEMHKRIEGLAETLNAAAAGVLDTPAPDLAGLRWKLEYLTDGMTNWPAWEGMEQVHVDIARLLPEGE